jgi:hypothetical protein
VPGADERAACLSAVDALGLRVDETDSEPGGCDGGALSVDDIALR